MIILFRQLNISTQRDAFCFVVDIIDEKAEEQVHKTRDRRENIGRLSGIEEHHD